MRIGRSSTLALTAAVAGAALGGCTMATMRGFDAMAPTTELVELRGIGGGERGGFALANGATGRFERMLVTASAGADDFGRPLGPTERRGRTAFAVEGPGVAGRLSGECRTFQAEYNDTTDDGRDRPGRIRLDTTTTVVPLRHECRFARDGRPIGGMNLGEPPPQGIQIVERRLGEVMVDGRRLTIVSEHKPEGPSLGGGFETRLGYRFEEDGGRTIGMASLNGPPRLALPRDPALREVALAAGIALALFRDPADL